MTANYVDVRFDHHRLMMIAWPGRIFGERDPLPAFRTMIVHLDHCFWRDELNVQHTTAEHKNQIQRVARCKVLLDRTVQHLVVRLAPGVQVFLKLDYLHHDDANILVRRDQLVIEHLVLQSLVRDQRQPYLLDEFTKVWPSRFLVELNPLDDRLENEILISNIQQILLDQM